MKFKFRYLMLLCCALTFVLLAVNPVAAQSPAIEWTRWDATITVSGEDQPLRVAEVQEMRVTSGTVRTGNRSWEPEDRVQVQSVFVVPSGTNRPVSLTTATSAQPAAGQYVVTQGGDGTILRYALPEAQSTGSTYVVQINYTAVSRVQGNVDWYVVPKDRGFIVRSSTVVIRLPAGQAPDPSLVAASAGSVSVNGSEVRVTNTNIIDVEEAFTVRLPYGANVGAAGAPAGGSSGGQPVAPVPTSRPVQPAQPAPTGGVGGLEIDWGSILLIGGAVLMFVLFGMGGSGRGAQRGSNASSLITTILGALMRSGGLSSRGRRYSDTDPVDNDPTPPRSTSGSGGRGFTPSSRQDRNIGRVDNDKDRTGGGAGVG